MASQASEIQDQIKELSNTKYGLEGVERVRNLGLIGFGKKVSEPEDAEELLKEKERKIVDEEDVENALRPGRNPVMTLPSGRILIERQVLECRSVDFVYCPKHLTRCRSLHMSNL